MKNHLFQYIDHQQLSYYSFQYFRLQIIQMILHAIQRHSFSQKRIVFLLIQGHPNDIF
jgi:hypothetical protein